MLGIILVNYKNEDKTIAYVQEELSKVSLPHLVVIVNNSAEVLTNNKLVTALDATLITDIHTLPKDRKNCFIIPSDENLGFAKGNNLGASFLNKHFNDLEYLLFSNNDIRFVDSDVVDKLKEKLNQLSDVALIGPNIIGTDGEKQNPVPFYSFGDYCFRMRFTPFMSLEKKTKRFKLDYSKKATEGIHYKLSGSFFMVKSRDFFNCGMMDPNTFLYAEEMILTERLLRIKKYTYFFPDVTIVHEHNQTISLFMKEKKRYLQQLKSDSYYYHTYKGVGLFSILMGKISLMTYFYLKTLLKK